MLKDELLLVVGLQYHRILIESLDFPQFRNRTNSAVIHNEIFPDPE